MAELLQFETDGDLSVIVEVDDTEPGFETVSREGGIAQAATKFARLRGDCSRNNRLWPKIKQ